MKYLTSDQFSTTFQVIALICLLGYSGFTSNRDMQRKTLADTTGVKGTAFTLTVQMRNLWDDYATWTRTVLLCRVDQTPGTEQATKRLLLNQEAIGISLKPYYGAEAARKLTLLLNRHIIISEEVVKAAREKDSTRLKEINKRWYSNADEISSFLSKRNPDWAFSDIRQILNEQIRFTNEQLQQRINKNYDADMIACDKVHDELLKMSVIISDGIIKQFPEKFITQATETVSK